MGSNVKIEIGNAKPVPFEKLCKGAFFTLASDPENIVYQRVSNAYSSPNDAGYLYNAIKVSTGGHGCFNDDEKVYKMKGVLKLDFE
jgi:hypothetical protein